VKRDDAWQTLNDVRKIPQRIMAQGFVTIRRLAYPNGSR